jgi:hypothetical protein
MHIAKESRRGNELLMFVRRRGDGSSLAKKGGTISMLSFYAKADRHLVAHPRAAAPRQHRRVLGQVKHARYYWLLLAESHLTRRRFGTMLRRIWALPVPMG